jgi:hypothetical protein
MGFQVEVYMLRRVPVVSLSKTFEEMSCLYMFDFYAKIINL